MTDKVYLQVPFTEKDQVKKLGGRWDPDAKRWWTVNSADAEKRFKQWWPAKQAEYDSLSDEQKSVIEAAKRGENVLVDACIGSGKTTTIQVLCNVLKGKRILYLTFNKLLKVDAQAKITADKVLVTNYDGFAFRCLHNSNLPTDKEKNIRLFNTYLPRTPAIDLLIMDEYQDIKEDIAEMLQILADRNPLLQIVAVGDMQQKIYNFTALDIEKFMSEFLGPNVTKINFTQCFRLSAEHAEKLGKLWDKDIKGVNTNCKTLVMNDLKDVIKFIADKDPKDLLVLGQRKGDVVRVLNALELHRPDKFNKNTCYASIRDGEDMGQFDRNNLGIFTTYDSSKGLERKYCIVLDWTHEYYMLRRDQPGVEYTTLRNLFLVAASRGKEYNVFLDCPKNENHISDRGVRNLISNLYYGKTEKEIPEPSRFDSELLKIPFEKPYVHERPFVASNMYDFLYAEDVSACSELIEEKSLGWPIEEIKVKTNDGTIDLSQCIGNYVEASFFEGYDIDNQRWLALANSNQQYTPARVVMETDDKGKPKRTEIAWTSDKATIEDKTLMLACLATGQLRYCTQVTPPFITPEQKQSIADRLATVFSGKERSQVTCQVDFDSGRIYGVSDVVTDDTVWELKFTTELKETHKLQLAFYLCSHPGKRGVLWNVRTNEAIEIKVKDPHAFLQRTVYAMSKRNYKSEYTYKLMQPGATGLDVSNRHSGVTKVKLNYFLSKSGYTRPASDEYHN